jgi:uncharacterized membrane protein YgcG
VPPGDAFTPLQRQELERAIADAEKSSGRAFSVYVGPANPSPRAFAERLHGRLADPPRSVLVMVDPGARCLEVVTGSEVRRTLTDRQAALAVLSMQTALAAGDLTRGLVAGLRQLGELARRPRTLHGDTP